MRLRVAIFFVTVVTLAGLSVVAQPFSAASKANRVVLELCDDNVIDLSAHSVLGGCGEKVRLPDDWLHRDGAKLYRGIRFGSDQPNAAARRDNLTQRFAVSNQKFEHDFRRNSSVSDPLRVADWKGREKLRQLADWPQPIDLFVLVSDGPTVVAADWNCDLTIYANEVYTIGPRQSEHPVKDQVVRIRMVSPESNETDSDILRLDVWTTNSLGNLDVPQLLRLADPEQAERPSSEVGVSMTDDAAWREHYDSDPVVRRIATRRDMGMTPDAIVEQASQTRDASPLAAARATLLSLDQTEIRKNHLPRVVSAADEVIRLIGNSDIDQTEHPKRFAWIVDALYRKGRALGYMELPEVITEHPIENRAEHDQAFRETYRQIASKVDMDDIRFVLLQVRHHRRSGRPGLAFEKLQIYRTQSANPRWYLKKQRDLASDTLPGVHQRVAHALWFVKSL